MIKVHNEHAVYLIDIPFVNELTDEVTMELFAVKVCLN